MKKKLFDLLVCPGCKKNLRHDRKASELLCETCCLAYPVRDGIPVLLEDDARCIAANGQAEK